MIDDFKFKWGQSVRLIGGKYNGFQGTVRWCGDAFASLEIVFENKKHEIVEDLRFLQDLAEWKAGKSDTELALKDTGGV